MSLSQNISIIKRQFFLNTRQFSLIIFLVCIKASTLIKGSPDPSHLIFEINIGKRRIRHGTNDTIFNRLGVDLEIYHSISESLYIVV